MPGQIGFDYDWKPQGDGSYSPEQMHRLLYDLNDEPNWRPNASLEMQFYDGNQLDQPTLALMAERGIPPHITNVIQPAIDNALGYEEIMRTDVIIKADDEKSFETAMAVNAKYKEAERLTDFDNAVAHAFADMMRIGIGWIGVTRNGDPFKYPYRVKHVPWREMWWDWRARDFNLQDARYVIRRHLVRRRRSGGPLPPAPAVDQIRLDRLADRMDRRVGPIRRLDRGFARPRPRQQ